MDFSPYSAYLNHLLMQGLEVTGCHKAECEITWNESHQVGLDSYRTVIYSLTPAKLIFLQSCVSLSFFFSTFYFCQSEPSSCRGLAEGLHNELCFEQEASRLTGSDHACSIRMWATYLSCFLKHFFSWDLFTDFWDACQKTMPNPSKLLKNAH